MNQFITLLAVSIVLFPLVPQVFGHGFGLDTISDVTIADKKLSITIEMPTDFDPEKDAQLTITATDQKSKESAQNVTFLVGLFHDDEMIFRNYFFAPNGVSTIILNPTDDENIKITGNQDSLLGAWHGTDSQPVTISGPVFESGGLYQFEIEIRTIDEPTNIIENEKTYSADVSVIEVSTHPQKDSNGNDVNFRMKSYFDSITEFRYEPENDLVEFEMPFDWSDSTISHIPVVHEEVHFPKDFVEFWSPSYVGKVNDVELFKSSITIDDYTEEDERIVHFVLLGDHLKYVKNEMQKNKQEIPDKMIFSLTKSEKSAFPMIAMTKNEELQVDLSWDPPEISPDQKTKFVFTIRDGRTGEPMRQSTYDFVIIQNGNEIHRNSGNAAVGGAFEDYTFSEDQTGPTIIRFENIRNTGYETEFGVVVVPEFGAFAGLVLLASLLPILVISRRLKRLF